MPYCKCTKTILVLALSLFLLSTTAWSATNEIRITSVGWTGVTVKSELAVAILDSLGYKASNLMTSVPICYKSMATGDADIFLGNWMPSMESVARPHFENGSVIQLVANMPGAQYTLAVPTFEAKAGLKDFSDIVKFGDKLGWKIYGIEEGNDGNDIIQSMIDKNLFGLGKFELVPSSEPAMLAQVQSFIKDGKWIVFLGWAPHSMNENINMTYLTGSTDETFGADDGMATVYTNVRKGFPDEQPNVTQFLKQLTFPISMMNQIMVTMHANPDLKGREAGLQWVAKHPEIAAKWLDGVTTVDGKPALPVFEKVLATYK